MRNSILIIASLFIAATGVHAQESGMKPNELMLKYRDMALDYNHDIRSAKENISAYMNLSGAAKADLKPKVSANAAYQYVDKPMELSFSIPSFDTPLGFQGAHNNYAATLAITQPIYSGGRLTQFVKKSGYQKDYAVNEMAMMKDVVSQQSDVTYWSCVARKEIAGVIEESKNSVGKLVTLIKQRVDLGYTDPGDILMAEVKYNEIE